MKVYNEEDYLMLSGIQHFAFCPRQWALIHIENQWEENVRTVEGNIMHKRAHDGPQIETRKNLVVSRQMKVYSILLQIVVIHHLLYAQQRLLYQLFSPRQEVKFKKCKKGEEGVRLYGREGLYKVHPVEYKKGEPKENNADRLQLVAQVICLEEMMCTRIEEGDLYYGTTKRREHVEITDSLRQEVENICLQMHQYFDRQYTPNIKRTKSCNACSLKNICLPQLSKKKSVHNYILKTIKDGEL